MLEVHIVVGCQWGDEGKGKWIDVLSADCDMVARYQGGNNAGHTLWIEGQKYVLNHLPSGVFRPSVVNVLLAGMVINPLHLLSEIRSLPNTITLDEHRLWISRRCHVITPWHLWLDEQRELRRPCGIGTTKKGIGPAYADRTSRIGLCLEHAVDSTKRRAWMEAMAKEWGEFEGFVKSHEKLWQDFEEALVCLSPYLCDAEHRLRQKWKAGKDKKHQKILCEGAQGTLLDVCHGTYPFVTSSHTIAAGALVSLGWGCGESIHTIGIAKAYTTRVGAGPFPTELTCANGQILAEKGQEKGATTGRDRRCGWLDLVALRYSCEVNGLDEIYLNKLDILCYLPSLKVCVGYEHPLLGRIDYFPSDHHILSELTCVYREFLSWDLDELTSLQHACKHATTPAQRSVSLLGSSMLNYISFIEEFCGVPVTRVGIGAAREAYLSKET
ncbi:MAG: adenylosuccinate synthase [Proteobacteria bacterium]|nr:adenylosuccinate synthase [Pseudomonadota bacterium]